MSSPSVHDINCEAGIFTTITGAQQAVRGLLEAGFTSEHITVVCSNETNKRHFREFEHQNPAGTNTTKAAVVGGTVGAALGGLSMIVTAPIAGLALWAAGPIAGLVGAGAVAGGLVGAMMTRGVEKELANYYQQAVIDGRILVAAEHSGPNHTQRLAKAAQVLAEAGALPLPLAEG